MENRTTTNTFLQFLDRDGSTKLVSIESILDGGVPIFDDGENEGDDMELMNDDLVDVDGNPV